MKRIYNTLIAVTAFLVFAPLAHGQSINDVIPGLTWPKEDVNVLQQSTTSDFAYRKDISAPQSDGTYWIKLESFSTGAATRILSSTPSDVILVLDSSSSMNTADYGGTVTYTARNSANYTYNSLGASGWGGSAPSYYYKHTDNNYYLVSRGQSGNVYYLSIDVNGTTYYLYNNGIQTNLPNSPTRNDRTIWTGVLYDRNLSGAVTRISALQDAVKDFIDSIHQNDVDVTAQNSSYPGNRIAIVTYDNDAYVLNVNTNQWVSNSTGGTLNSNAQWIDAGDDTAVDNLKGAVDNISRHNWTRPAYGLSSAITNFLSGTSAQHQQRDGASLTVVVFTDGVPCHNSGSGNDFQAEDANAAIHYGHVLKSTYGATLFTVGLLDLNGTSDHIKRGIHFLDLLSSNYPNSDIAENSTAAWNVSGNTVTIANNALSGGSADDKASDKYFQLVDENTDLSSIFQTIAEQSGGSSSSLSAASRNVDVVSNSFILPEGTTAENIGSKVKIFIAKVNGFTYDNATQKYACTFSTEILKEEIPTMENPDLTGYYYYPLDDKGNRVQPEVLNKVDTGINVAYNEATQAVTVTGFDYSSCFCGPIFDQNYTPSNPPTYNDLANHATFQGFKIIIMIPIKMNPDAVGGPDVNTNGAGSGIFVQAEGGDALVAFKSPTVSLPVNIHLKKTGLGAGESAKFRIERADIPTLNEGETFDPAELPESAWSYVSTVFVTKPQGSSETDPDPVVKVRGLPANRDDGEGASAVHKSFVYRVTEENWSWSYTSQTPAQYTTTSNVTNPFTFSNLKKDNIDVKVRHAESKATNIFKEVDEGKSNVEYDDSKPNNR